MSLTLFACKEVVHTASAGPTQCVADKQVIISRRAGEAVLRGAHVFVPGVLACSQSLCKGDEVTVSIVSERPKNASSSLLRGTILNNNASARPELLIGRGIAQLSRQDIFKADSGVGIEMTDRVFRLAPCHALPSGIGMLQNLPSAVVAHVLKLPPGATVLDMCAAPGGKATHLAQLMSNEGTVIALDRTHAKAQHIRKLAAELGVSTVKAYKMDATKALLQTSSTTTEGIDGVVSTDDSSPAAMLQQPNAKEQRRRDRKARVRAMHGQAPIHTVNTLIQPVCKGFKEESFDYVLLDAPCSALGLRPRLTHHTTMTELRQAAAYQRKLLHVAVKLLKPGGHLVYSTCTINPGENEANVAFALQAFPLKLVQQHPCLGGPGFVGSCTYEDGYREEWLTQEQAALVQRFDPCSDLDTIGFFIAKFCKISTDLHSNV